MSNYSVKGAQRFFLILPQLPPSICTQSLNIEGSEQGVKKRQKKKQAINTSRRIPIFKAGLVFYEQF